MCGRVRLEADYTEIANGFRVADLNRLNFPPRYNSAPTQDFPVLRFDPEKNMRTLSLMKWGLIPAWAKDAKNSAQSERG